MKGWRFGIQGIAACLMIVAVGISWFWYQAWQPMGGDGPIRVVIRAGSSLRQVGSQLYQEGVIRSPWAWDMRNRWQPWVIKAGTYDLDPRQDLGGVIESLKSGQTVHIRITIPEGWRILQMDGYLRDDIGIPDFATAVRDFTSLPWIPERAPSLEGFLFPDTYFLPIEDLSASTLVQAMVQQFHAQALPLWQQHTPPPDLDLLQWVTLASIVEKEAVLPQERRLIAGVFWQRLQRGIPLGADPTVEYFLNIRQTPTRRLTFAEVRIPSPYNTYLNPGLPPGPIASPGLASLRATLDPEPTEYLYFVARYDGSHVFSRTLAEHEAAQRQIIREQAGGS